MASLIGEQVFQITGQASPPLKDFFQLEITKHEVIWRCWMISLRAQCKGAPPSQLKIKHQDFLHDRSLKEKVVAVFGRRILEYTESICEGRFDYLERLPDDILLRIVSFLQPSDIFLLAQVSNRFRKLCNSETFWEQTARKYCVWLTPDMEHVPRAMGWRKFFFCFFPTSNEQ